MAPSVRRPLWKQCCCCCCISIVAFPIIAILIFFIALRPFQAMNVHELAHHDELERLADLDSLWRPRKYAIHLPADHERPPPYNARLTPLIHDITQLWSWSYLQQMNLNQDGTAEYPTQQHWIYVGGKAQQNSTPGFFDKISHFINPLPPNGTCIDPPEMCDSFNAAYNQLLEHYHTERYRYSAHTGLTFIDCDVSPNLCGQINGLSVHPIMLIHVQTKQPCKTEFNPFRFICSVKWSYVPLPLSKMPVPATTRIGGYVVPSFPTPFEQLRQMIGFEGSVDALDLEEHEVEDNIVRMDGDEDEGADDDSDIEWLISASQTVGETIGYGVRALRHVLGGNT